MNREILFRAKRKDNGEWMEGYYVLCRGCHYILPIFNNDALYHGYDERYDEWIEIEPSTVCQYTGLTDKKDLKIYENDFISCHQYIGGNLVNEHIERGFVEMKHGAFGLHRNNPDAYYRPFKDWMEDYEYEVIGNIFENPELVN